MFTQQQRERLLPTLDALAQPLGLYAAYHVTEGEHVTTVERTDIEPAATAENVGSYLVGLDYEYNGLAALKYASPLRRTSDDGSYRKVPEEHPDLLNRRITEAFEPEECQYHVHLFDNGEGRVDLYSHHETRPDLFEPSPSLRRLREHYRPEYGETYVKGVVSPGIVEVLNA